MTVILWKHYPLVAQQQQMHVRVSERKSGRPPLRKRGMTKILYKRAAWPKN